MVSPDTRLGISGVLGGTVGVAGEAFVNNVVGITDKNLGIALTLMTGAAFVILSMGLSLINTPEIREALKKEARLKDTSRRRLFSRRQTA